MTVPVSLDSVLGTARIAFGLMFAVKLYFSVDANRLVWAHRLPFERRSVLHAALGALATATACFTVGFATGPAALAQWLLYVWLFRYASLYGLEDVAFHTLAFYFVFAGAGAHASVDALLGTGVWGRLPFAASRLPEVALATALGNIFLSAGITKLRSPMWQRGMGAYFFFLLPNFRRCSTALLTRNERVIRAVNHMALAMEVGLLPALLINAVPLGILFWVMGVTFTILLATVFVLTWIGEAMTVGMVITAWLLLDTGRSGLGARWISELGRLTGAGGLALGTLLAGTILAGLWTALMPDAKPVARWPWLAGLYRRSRYLVRLTWGFLPCDVFTEAHMEGSIVYRVYAVHDGTADRTEVFRIYGPGCGPGPDRRLRPTFYEVTSYKVAEACMEMDRDGEVRTPERRQFMLRLADYIAGKVAPRATVSALAFQVVQLVPPATFCGAASGWYLDEPWRDTFRVEFENGRAAAIRPLVRPALKAPTGRNLDRLSFEFLPMAN